MEKFQKVILRRLLLLVGFSAVSILFILTVGNSELVNISNGNTKDFISGFQKGGYIGMQIMLAFQMGSLIPALTNKDSLKALYIKEHDERNMMIQQKIGAFAVYIIMMGVTLATIVSGFFNEIVFFTLLSTLVFIAAVIGVSMLYWSKKY